MDDIRQMAIASIKDSTMLYMSCDVNKQYNRDRGYSDPMNYQYGPLLGTTFDWRVQRTICNGVTVYNNGILNKEYRGEEVSFR